VYGLMLTFQPNSKFQLTTAVLMRVPFLFVVSLFYGYFVTEIRSRRSDASEARLREQAKGELLTAVSHDLRGPLGNAEGLLGLVLDGQGRDPADSRALLLRAQSNVRRVSSLVVNLLQAAALEAGQLHLQLRPVQLNDVVEDVFSAEVGAALLKNITLVREMEANIPIIDADFMQLGRITANLVDNAVKYTAAGGTVVIRTAHDAESVTISVQDSGPGMTGQQCEELFAPYRRVHLSGYAPGTGLGLYIVKRLTEAHGGKVHVTSQPNVGSTFTVSFPRRREAHELPAARRYPAAKTRTFPSRPAAAVATHVEPA
jgi:two-component system phosphate regulon sensor histidine kinase PhoR